MPGVAQKVAESIVVTDHAHTVCVCVCGASVCVCVYLCVFLSLDSVCFLLLARSLLLYYQCNWCDGNNVSGCLWVCRLRME